MLRSPAKLNWTLEVLGQREDGFHELRSWFVAAAFYDELSCVPSSDQEAALVISGPASKGLPTDSSNLILRAEQAWRSAGGIAPQLCWSLVKNIPAGAGLGGGSGNAAAAFRLLEAIGDGSAVKDLAGIALEIGSDVPFFLEQESAVLLGGRGETRLAAASAAEGWVVLAVPSFAVNTGWVFAQLQAQACEPGASGIASETALVLPALPTENDLLESAEKAYPELQEFHAKLDAAADFQLSGSGGTFFAFFPDFEAAENCAAHTRKICSQVFVAPLQHGAILRAPISIPSPGAKK